MFCKNCGAKNPEGANFCEKCGSVMPEPLMEDANLNEKRHGGKEIDAGDGKQEGAEKDRRLSGKKIIVIAAGAAILILCLVMILIYMNGQKSAAYHTKLEGADKYLQEMDYEKAETAYLEAIEIQPKKEEAYIKLSDMYTEQGKHDEALEILEKGQEMTSGSAREAIVEKIKEVEGQGNSQYQAYYELCMEYLQKYGEPGWEETNAIMDTGINLTGLCVVKLFDFNKDGNQELILAYLDQDEVSYQYEIWAWEEGELVNVLEAAELNTGQYLRRWISAVMKDDVIYLEQSGAFGMESFRYLQYENGSFVSKYEAECDPSLEIYEINGESVTEEAYDEALNNFPASQEVKLLPSYEWSDELYITEDEFVIDITWIAESYADKVIEETNATIEILRKSAAEKQTGVSFADRWV